jgi:LPPG:FO 2-phospho-L-lactate transferase
MLDAGYPLSAVTAALCERWKPGVTLLPMSDQRVETHVVIDEPSGRRAVHFQEWWVGLHASVPALEFVSVGAESATAGPGVLEALRDADVVLLPPSNPVVSIGSILAVPGIADALRSSAAPVVGTSPIIGGAPVRGMADACLKAIGVETSATAVAVHYGSRAAGGLIDGWLVDDSDSSAVDEVQAVAIACRARPLLMTDVEATAAIAGDALNLAAAVRG